MVVPFEVKLGVNPEVDFQILESHNYSLQQTQEGRGVTYIYEAPNEDRIIELFIENNKVIAVCFVYHPYDADWYKVDKMYNSIYTYITKRLKYTFDEDKGFSYYGKKVRAKMFSRHNQPKWNYEPFIVFMVTLL